MKSLHTDMLIMDEAQRLKNWNTQIAKAARRLQSQYTVVLSERHSKQIRRTLPIAQLDPYCLGPYYKFINKCLTL